MISIYKSDQNGKLNQIDHIEQNCWINMVEPSKEEILLISKKTGIPIEYLKSALDEEESSRIEVEDDNILIIVDIPFTQMEYNSLTYDTYPLAIIHTSNEIVTVSLRNSRAISDFIEGKVNLFYTFKRSRFILQILYRIAKLYLVYLRQIDKKSMLVQNKLHRSMKNKELIQMLALEKSLVYFSTSLKANEITLEKMLRLKIMQKYEEDKDILEDVIIENKQAIEMCNIYRDILSGTMDAFASVISNNLNIVMKFLAAITIVMSIPTLVSGLFGMNVNVPFADTPYGFWYIILMIVLLCLAVVWILNKKDMF